MARYLLDTTVLIDHLKGQQKAVELIARLAGLGHEIGVSAINIAELYSGLDDKGKVVADKLINRLNYFEITGEIAKIAGSYRFKYGKKGLILTTADTLVAATAINYGAVLVTANVKDYPMEQIEILRQA